MIDWLLLMDGASENLMVCVSGSPSLTTTHQHPSLLSPLQGGSPSSLATAKKVSIIISIRHQSLRTWGNKARLQV